MPSKKRGKGKARRRAAKGRKELKNDDGGTNGVKNVELRMQQLQINKDDQDDEDTFLEEAINLAAEEREQLESSATNEEENKVERCDHGFSPLPRGHVCARFIPSFLREFVQRGCLRSAIEALKTKYDGLLYDPDMLELVVSSFLEQGIDMLLRGNDDNARRFAVFAAIFEQLRMCRGAMKFNNAAEELKKCTLKIKELADDTCDEHTLVSFFRKRIPCKCLDKRYKEVKSIVKMGHCMNPDCPLPNMKAECSKLMKCEQCRLMQYCSIECQRAHWPRHKKGCVEITNLRCNAGILQNKSKE